MSAPAAPGPDPAFLRDVLDGLARSPRAIPAKWFYDEAGSALFEAITRTEAYYPTRTERAIMEAHAGEMAAAIGPRVALVEYGSGSSRKTRLLLDALAAPAAYVPLDISEAPLQATAARLRADYPALPVLPIVGDFTSPPALPPLPSHGRSVVYFPGSTIGNFEPAEVPPFLAGVARVAGPGGGLLLGVDRKKDPAVLDRAYNDPEGVTAAFNLNLLARINRELGADFDVDAWTHRAGYDAAAGRVEMHLVSRRDQTVRVGGRAFAFAAGEAIHTESSYKYGPGEVEALAARAGLVHRRTWADARGWFAVLWFEARGSAFEDRP